MIENAGFRSLMRCLEVRYDIPSRTPFAQKLIPKLYQSTREKVEAAMKTSPIVAMTTDGWTSRATESYITITAHTIDQEFKLHEYVLQTRATDESHTGKHVADVLDKAVEEWSLKRPGMPITLVNKAVKF